MGGADSEVHDGTTRIVFESAWFKPASIRATSKRLGLRTEASMRFERGADLTAPAKSARARLSVADSRLAPDRRGDTSKTCIRVRMTPSKSLSSDAASRHCSAWTCPMPLSCGFCGRSASRLTSRSNGWRRDGSRLARRHPSARRSDRGARTPPRIRTFTGDVPSRAAGSGRVRPSHCDATGARARRSWEWAFPRRSRSPSSKKAPRNHF